MASQQAVGGIIRQQQVGLQGGYDSDAEGGNYNAGMSGTFSDKAVIHDQCHVAITTLMKMACFFADSKRLHPQSLRDPELSAVGDRCCGCSVLCLSTFERLHSQIQMVILGCLWSYDCLPARHGLLRG